MTRAVAQANRGLGGEHRELRLYEVNCRFQHVADARNRDLPEHQLRWDRAGPVAKLDEG
jgi:hypothetical protein